MRPRPLAAAAIALSVLVACAEPPDGRAPEAPETTPVMLAPEDPGCVEWKCTGNSPDMSGYEFHELHERQVPNEAGFILRRLRKGGAVYHPDVRGDRLYGLGPGGVILLQDAALEGAELVLEHDTIPGEFTIRITAVNDNVTFWVAPHTPVQTYELDYTAPGGPKREPLCANPPASDSGDGNLWVAPGEAILFSGDRYDRKKRIFASTATEAGDWFNIGCAGSALAKMHLNRFTTAGKRPAQPATRRAERQDVLSMYTGNVCGTGVSYTVPGTQIRWGTRNSYRVLAGFATYEAIWSGGRAVCMSSWRLDDTHPELREQMKLECGELPPCSDADVGSWQLRGSVISGVP